MGDPCGLGRELDEKTDITPPDPDEHDPAFADGPSNRKRAVGCLPR